jgi:hypothetical protein
METLNISVSFMSDKNEIESEKIFRPSPEMEGIGLEEDSRAPEATKSKSERIPQMELKWYDTGTMPRVKLVNEAGEKAGEAEFRLLTTPDLLQKTSIDLDQWDEAKAEYVGERVEESGIVDVSREHIAENRLHAALHIIFRNFNEVTGGQVLEATKVTWNQDQANFGSVSPSDTTEDRVVRTFIIARSAKGDMESMLSSQAQGSIEDSGLGLQFDIDPIYNDFLGDRGFTRRVRVTAENGVSKEMRLNFIYGSERDVEADEGGEDEDEDGGLK